MYEIPTSILIGDKEFPIRNKGDFRIILDCFEILKDVELSKTERVIASLIVFYEGMSTIDDLTRLGDIKEAVRQMYWFFNCGQEQSPGMKVNHSLIDWSRDSMLISSAINKVAGKEIRSEPYIHWWTFMGYYLAIGEGPLATIVGIRNKIVEGRKLEKYEQKFRMQNPQYFTWNWKTAEEMEAEELGKQLWNSGK